MTRYIFQMDVEHFFPTWGKMTKEEQAAWRKKWRAWKARCRGNTGVTPGKQNFLQSNFGQEIPEISTQRKQNNTGKHRRTTAHCRVGMITQSWKTLI